MRGSFGRRRFGMPAARVQRAGVKMRHCAFRAAYRARDPIKGERARHGILPCALQKLGRSFDDFANRRSRACASAGRERGTSGSGRALRSVSFSAREGRSRSCGDRAPCRRCCGDDHLPSCARNGAFRHEGDHGIRGHSPAASEADPCRDRGVRGRKSFVPCRRFFE